jgi:hypothetical protein
VTVKNLDKNLFLSDEIREVYREIMKTVPSDHLNLDHVSVMFISVLVIRYQETLWLLVSFGKNGKFDLFVGFVENLIVYKIYKFMPEFICLFSSKAVTYAFPPGYRENAEEEEFVWEVIFAKY